MASIIFPITRTRQPQINVDADTPYIWTPFNEFVARTGTFKLNITPSGIGVTAAGANGSTTSPKLQKLISSPVFTIISYAYVNSSGTTAAEFLTGNDNSNTAGGLALFTGGVLYRTTGSQITITGTATAGKSQLFAFTMDASGGKFYIDGILQNSNASTLQAISIATYPAFIAGTGAINARGNQPVYYVAQYFGVAKTQSELLELSNNPWQIFAPERRRIWVPSFSTSDVTVAITGNSSTTSVGSTSVSSNVGITGSSSTGSVGTVVAVTGITVDLTGVSSAGSVGNLTITNEVTESGVSSTTNTGTITTNISTVFAGVSSTGDTGNLTTESTTSLTGIVNTGELGTLVSNIAVAITGVSGTGSVGSTTPAYDMTIQLSGVSTTASVGNILADITKAVTGNESTASVGDVDNVLAVALSGNEALGLKGSVYVDGVIPSNPLGGGMLAAKNVRRTINKGR